MIEISVPPSMKRCCEDRVDHAVENTRSVGRELGRPTAHPSRRGLFGRVVGLPLICFVGGLCSIAYEQLWAVFDKLPCLEIGLALKGLVL